MTEQPIYLDMEDGNLVLTQKGGEAAAVGATNRIVLTPAQVTSMVDILLGPKRVHQIDVGKILAHAKKPE